MTQSQSILHRLKNETESHHRRVEKRFQILDPQLTLTRYREWLVRLYGYYDPLECLVEPWCAEIAIDWPERRKTPLLAQDLLRLGMTQPQLDALPRCEKLPVIDTIANVFGALYVFEGSTLGGRFIAHHLATHLHLNTTNGASFFLPYGDDPKPRWHAFQKRLLDIASSDDITENIIATAAKTFDSFEAWLSSQDL